MKRTVTLILSLLAMMSMAFAYNAEMVIQSNNGPFLLKVDGRTINRSPQAQVVISNLDAGNHHITMRMVDGRPNTLQFDRVYLPQNERVIFTLVRRGRDAMTLQKTASEPLRHYATKPRQAGPRGQGRGNGYGSGQGQYSNDNFCYEAMHPQDFQQAIRAVYNSRGFENQARTAKQITRTNCLSSRQLAKLLKAMNIEDHRLQVAKIGWERVTDPENFHIVEQQIHHTAYRRSLQDYMQHHPRLEPKFSPARKCQSCVSGSCGAHGIGDYYQEDQHDDGYYGDGGYDEPYNQPLRVVSDQEFRRLLRDIRQAPFDKDKLQLGKRMVEQTPMSSEQVGQLLSILAYDSYRLKLAKHAYRFVVDPENYHTVKRAFSYTSYRRQLEDFIR